MLTHRHSPSKIVLLGNSNAGKTSLLDCAVSGISNGHTLTTIGCNCQAFTVRVGQRDIMLNVWDTAGQEIYRSIVPIYVRSATGAIIVYDVTDRASFTAVSDWYELMAAEELPSGVDLYVVGNKIDRADDRVVDGDSGKEMSASIRGKFFEVSALAGIGVRELFEAIAAAQALRQRTDSDTVGHGMDAGGGCC